MQDPGIDLACVCHHRFGMAKYENGGRYEGEFQDDHRWGWGEHRFADGAVYEGEWFDDMIEGAHSSAMCLPTRRHADPAADCNQVCVANASPAFV